ncbi:MAG: 6-phosphogluconolactonase [Litorimonas sp.]
MINTIETGDGAVDVAEKIAQHLRRAIDERGQASLMVSGGSSPKPVYIALSKAKLPWEKVTIGLVDERWVDMEEDGSNETFICNNLLQNYASKAQFIGMKTAHDTPAQAINTLHMRFENCPKPFDVCVMGMGLDGHTASWFPKSQGLSAALDENNPDMFCAINAQGCLVAGDHPLRMSLTASAVLSARHIILFIPGAAKGEVYLSANKMTKLDAPVKILSKAGQALSVFCPNQ